MAEEDEEDLWIPFVEGPDPAHMDFVYWHDHMMASLGVHRLAEEKTRQLRKLLEELPDSG